MNGFEKKRIAIIHDIFSTLGGSEYVAQELAMLFPQADIFTTWFEKKNPFFSTLQKRVKHSFHTNTFHYLLRYKNYLKPFLYSYWESLDLSSYDIIISSSHAFSSKAVITSPQQLHICYCHTPPKYLYTEFSESQIRKSSFFLPHLILTYLRSLDFVAAQRADIMIANSQKVQQRIQKYYRRTASVIYPPVALPNTYTVYKKHPYYVSVGRLTKAKGIDMLIKACNKQKNQLLIVGDGEERKYLESIAGPTITFTGILRGKEKITAIKHAKAFLFCGIDEDFGIAPVEAMGYGTPVIGYARGGLSETVIHGKTGILFEDYSEEALLHAIKQADKKNFSQHACFIQAQKFSRHRFQQQIYSLLQKNI